MSTQQIVLASPDNGISAEVSGATFGKLSLGAKLIEDRQGLGSAYTYDLRWAPLNAGTYDFETDGVIESTSTFTKTIPPEGQDPVVVPLPTGFVHGARLAWVDVKSVKIGTVGETSKLRDDGDAVDIEFSGELIADITVAGAGGLDQGSEAADSWYAVHVIANAFGANPAALLSLSASAPTLPSGYEKFRRIGWVRNNGSSDFFKFGQAGNGRTRRYYYDDNYATMEVLQVGKATTFTDVDCSAFAPPTSRNIPMAIRLETGQASEYNDNIRLRPKGWTGNAVQRFGPGDAQQGSMKVVADVLCDANQIVQYRANNSTGNRNKSWLAVAGFDDEV